MMSCQKDGVGDLVVISPRARPGTRGWMGFDGMVRDDQGWSGAKVGLPISCSVLLAPVVRLRPSTVPPIERRLDLLFSRVRCGMDDGISFGPTTFLYSASSQRGCVSGA